MEDRTLLSTFDVTNTADSGSGSLRQAILDSDAATGQANTIDFSIGSGGVQTIAPLSPLPALTSSVTIDGTSQPGYDPNNPAPMIELSGQNITGTTAFGLEISGGDSTIEGLIVNRFPSSQIMLDTKGGDIVRGNDLGTAATGTVALGDSIKGAADLQNGLAVISSANTIGGTTPAARNVISGNGFNGIRIYSGASGNVVEGNYIGTDATGTKAVGNTYNGIDILDSTDNTIGGTAAGAGNVISGNRSDGVRIRTSQGTATGNVVEGNYIGTDASGANPLANTVSGVGINDASGNTIGGTTAAARNILSGNRSDGVFIGTDRSGATATGNVVEGNYIGTDVTGTKALGNKLVGVEIAASAWNNTIGGTAAGDRNVISGNKQGGVFIHGSATGNLVAGNYIGSDWTGTLPLGNSFTGVEIADRAWNNTIGGTAAGDRNVISGNKQGGVFIHGSATGNLVAGNYIGSDWTGTLPLGNSFTGVEIADRAWNNTIGGTAAGDCNVISGNKQGGVFIHGSATGNLVAGNYIGSDWTGTLPLGNSFTGVEIADRAWNNTIGGTAAGDRNVISGNKQGGVFIHGSATGNLVAGNFIGTDLTGTKALGNKLVGVEIADRAWNNTIGGTAAGDRNVISGNKQGGVFIHGSATGNLVAGNYIGSDWTGTLPLGNSFTGVEIADRAWNNTIGGTAAGDRNVISGNKQGGVFIHGSATGNLVAGNFIGTDLTGTKALGNGYTGVEIADRAWNNTIGGTAAGDCNVISGNAEAGVFIHGSATGNLVAGNYIGTDVTGTEALGNAYAGVEIADSASNNTIGGTAAGDRNVISGGVQGGLFIHGSATGNLVAGNYIGTDVTGTKALGNAYAGVEITESASNNTIGGTAAGDRNVISGSVQGGLFIHGSATGNLVAGNYIGTDVTGTKVLGNAYAGVEITESAWNNTIGGTAAGDRNVISGSVQGGGVFIHGSATGNLVAGNYIGTDVTGTKALGNALVGVEITESASNNTIGGTAAGDRNVISGNAGGGVFIDDSATGNLVEGNYISGNAGGGVFIDGSATGNLVAGNYISGNAGGGVFIAVQTVPLPAGLGDPNVFSVQGNAGATSNSGTPAGAVNGIWDGYVVIRVIIDAATTGVVVQYNFIGTEFTGTAALGNALFGVQILTFQLGGETGGMPTVPGLQPLSGAALPLIATLLTLTIETSTAEFDPGAFRRRGCRGRFIPTRKYGDCGAKPVAACPRARSPCHAGILILAAISHGAGRGPGPVLS